VALICWSNQAVSLSPCLSLFLSPPRRPGDIRAVDEDFRLGEVMTLAEDVHVTASRVRTGLARSVVQATWLVRVRVEVPKRGC
jgi:hypothetical protein